MNIRVDFLDWTAFVRVVRLWSSVEWSLDDENGHVPQKSVRICLRRTTLPVVPYHWRSIPLSSAGQSSVAFGSLLGRSDSFHTRRAVSSRGRPDCHSCPWWRCRSKRRSSCPCPCLVRPVTWRIEDDGMCCSSNIYFAWPTSVSRQTSTVPRNSARHTNSDCDLKAWSVRSQRSSSAFTLTGALRVFLDVIAAGDLQFQLTLVVTSL